jgi:hypothetical protein
MRDYWRCGHGGKLKRSASEIDRKAPTERLRKGRLRRSASIVGKHKNGDGDKKGCVSRYDARLAMRPWTTIPSRYKNERRSPKRLTVSQLDGECGGGGRRLIFDETLSQRINKSPCSQDNIRRRSCNRVSTSAKGERSTVREITRSRAMERTDRNVEGQTCPAYAPVR